MLHTQTRNTRLALQHIAVIFCLLIASDASAAETIRDETHHFTFSPPAGFIAQPAYVQPGSGVIHAFEYSDPAAPHGGFILLIKKLPGTISREPLDINDMPPTFKGSLFKTQWQGFEVDGFEVPESVNGVNTLTYNVQLPIKRNAIQIMLHGSVEDEAQLKETLPKVLAGFKGESNWIASAVPVPQAVSEDNYRVILIVVAAVIVLGGLFVLWLISNRAPRGTVLIIATACFFTGYFGANSDYREVLLVTGAVQLLGVVGILFGIVDAIWGRKDNRTLIEAREPAP